MIDVNNVITDGWDLARSGAPSEDLWQYAADAEASTSHVQDANENGLLMCHVHQWRSRVFRAKGDREQSIEHMKLAIAFGRVHDKPASVSLNMRDLGWSLYTIGRYDESLAILNESLVFAQGDDERTASAYNGIGAVHETLGDCPAALVAYRKGLEYAETSGGTDILSSLHTNIGNVLTVLKIPQAMQSYETALRLMKESENESGLANLYGNMGMYHHTFNNTSEAERFYTKGIEASRKHNMRREVGFYTQELAEMFIELGRLDEAAALIEANEAHAQANPEPRIGFVINRASLAFHAGDLPDALSILEHAIRLSDEFTLRDKKLKALKLLRDVLEKNRDFERCVKVNREVEQLSAEINLADQKQRIEALENEHRSATERRQAEAQRQLLYNTLPDRIADRLLKGEKFVADTYEDAAVLFLDVVDFTIIASKIPPGHLIHILNSIFGTCDEVISRHGLTKVKTIGDSYMAVCGVPVPYPDNTIRTAAAALELLGGLRDLRITMPEELGDRSWVEHIPNLNVRIGAHCGPVVAGVVGTTRVQFDIWGDTVNVASRMETSGQPERIQVSEAFALALTSNAEPQLLGNDVVLKHNNFVCRLRGTMEIKGKGEMRTFWLEG